MTTISEGRLRRAAKKRGLRLTKSRWRRDSLDNFGSWMIVDVSTNFIVNGSRFDLSDEDVAEYLGLTESSHG